MVRHADGEYAPHSLLLPLLLNLQHDSDADDLSRTWSARLALLLLLLFVSATRSTGGIGGSQPD